VVTNLMQSTLQEGTGQSARWRGFSKTGAGKTGTTNDNTNAWFCGFTPSFCAGVWVGFDEYVTMGDRKTGARMALPIWANFMGKITDQHGEEPFVRPPGIIEKQICCFSGKLATAQCDSTKLEIFLPTCAPNAVCDRHGDQSHVVPDLPNDFENMNDDDDDFSDF